MHRPPQLLTSLLLLGIGLALTAATSAARSRPVRIKWPSREFRDLQSAIDAAPDNAIVEIKAGVYEVSDPILVRGKRLVIKGAGSGFAGATARTPITHLIGPPPSPVLDERGDLVLRAEAVQGLWNFVAAGGVIQDMNLTGFDAAIVHKPGDRGDTGPVEVRNVVISHTGRGILSLSASNLRHVVAGRDRDQPAPVSLTAAYLCAEQVTIRIPPILGSGISGSSHVMAATRMRTGLRASDV